MHTDRVDLQFQRIHEEKQKKFPLAAKVYIKIVDVVCRCAQHLNVLNPTLLFPLIYILTKMSVHIFVNSECVDKLQRSQQSYQVRI